jgi:tetratricopeptide (TPR) repeat protein
VNELHHVDLPWDGIALVKLSLLGKDGRGMFGAANLPHEERRAKSLLGGLSSFLIAALFFLVVPCSDAADGTNPRYEAEQWEEVAKLRLQAARGHELQAERRRAEAFNPAGNLGTAGDALDLAGDERYSASEDYRIASKHWEKAAKAFRAAGDPDKTKDAHENAATAWDAARRALREGTELYKMAEEQFENVNDLDKKIKVIKKSARNIEQLMQMK